MCERKKIFLILALGILLSAAYFFPQTTYVLAQQGNTTRTMWVMNEKKFAQTGSINPTDIVTNLEDGFYRVSYYAQTTAAGSAGTVTVTINWNDGQARSNTSLALALTALANAPVVAPVDVQGIRVAAGSTISYSTTAVGIVGNPEYALYISVERIQ